MAASGDVGAGEQGDKHYPALTDGGPIAFGRYVLFDRIAMGGMADIYAAATPSGLGLPPIVAVKRLNPLTTTSPEFVAMFRDEARLMSRVDHPGLLRHFEHGQIDGASFIAMELVHGTDVRYLLDVLSWQKRRLPPSVAAWIVMRVAETLAYVHDLRDAHGRPLGLVHRDISPNNLMVGYDGQVKVIDFGIAKHSARSIKTTARVLKGTLGYMSPEQTWAEPLDPRSDIFSLGACFYEMLTGHRLFASADRIGLIQQVRKARVCPPSQMCADIPDELSHLVVRSLSREAEGRPASAAELSWELAAFLERSRVRLGEPLVGAYLRALLASDYQAESEWLASASVHAKRFPARAQVAARSHDSTIEDVPFAATTLIDARRAAHAFLP